MGIGENIRLYRKKKGLTQQQLADLTNLSRSYLADIERNRYNPSVDTLKSIAKGLQINPNVLLNEEFNDASTLSPKEERDIVKELERIMADLKNNEALAFHGEPIDEEEMELLRASLENSLRIAKMVAKKKFTPKKYRK
ncbi:helix-turn-helix domain-containing protein [Brevibacillus agri]|uniref:Helix-turn-helix domain-containing protein n=1 Tax=Brevibacillus panacihumi TaxID=497735 RepID=A0A3M8C8W1_9BACL|nr:MULTISPECIES: helix-turn-helix domain-containing protein [Brevibacillus]EJL43993.1 Helix-turn-helix protein [Brevibacillus sp. CF112]MBG9567539.1 XRE family transcriptional regulator [Brevibacillus agri]MBG9567618.1 XRE family transcriptional regulator [Brevibacillus agri]MED1646199.1 helix-turn-helix domain-containing protein [Brevibacillus agri]MED1654206.1 helix-turn-helix domain-containing protein [Brevibacillus agri]